MAAFANNPFEGSFENLTSSTQGTGKKVQKAVFDGIKTVGKDIKEQITGPQKSLVEEAGVKELPKKEQQSIAQQTEQNLAKINAEIKQIREERIKKEQEKAKAEAQEKQQKQAEEKKKKEDPMWLKAIKGQTGSQEGAKKSG